jgi:ribosome-binding factor A
MQQEIADIFLKELDLRDFGMISVLRVDTAPHLKNAKVFVHALHHNHKLIPYLEKKNRDIYEALKKRLSLRVVPHLLFREDLASSHTERIEELIVAEEKRMKERDDKDERKF